MTDRPTRPRSLSLLAAPALLLLAPLAGFLYYHRYPLLRGESALLLALALGTGLIYGLLLRRTGYLTRALLLWPLLVLALDLPFELGGRITLVALVALALAVLLRRHLPTLVTAMALAFLVTIPFTGVRAPIAGSENRPAPSVRDLPPVIHLILDEHIGLAGIPDSVPGGAALRQELTDQLAHWGFRSFPRAYARYFDTHNAIPNLLNFSAATGNRGYVRRLPGGVDAWRLRGSSYLEEMAARGYTIQIYQSDYLDLCHTPTRVAKCTTYPSNSLRLVADLDVGAMTRAAFVMNYFLEQQSHIYHRLHATYVRRLRPRLEQSGLPAPAWEWFGDRAGGLASLNVLDSIAVDLATAPRGRYILAHVLFPHYPYEVDAGCEPHADLDQRLDRHSPALELPEANTPESRAERYALYFEQVRCTWHRLDRFFGALDSLGLRQDATIILHGDHGSRITLHDPVERMRGRLTPADFADAYSTLFAVRARGIPPGEDDALQPVSRLLTYLVTHQFSAVNVAPPARHYVLIGGANNRLLPTPLPPAALPPTAGH